VTETVVLVFCRELEHAWSRVAEVEITVDNRETRPRLLQIYPPREGFVMLPMKMKIGAIEGGIFWGIPSPMLKILESNLLQQSQAESRQKLEQALRENLRLIGVPCRGMFDKRKIEAAIAAKTPRPQHAEIQEYYEKNEMVHVTTKNGDIHTFTQEEFLQDACIDCRYPLPEGTDYLIEGPVKEPGNGGHKKIEKFEAVTPQERWEYFMQEMSKCVRCSACRQACPTCWCKECFAEQTDLKWIGMSTNISDTMLFHLTRIFHQAGRCVECDACYRACPMGVDLRTFTKKIGKDVESLFAFYPDFNPETLPPLSTFKEEDSNNFITEP